MFSLTPALPFVDDVTKPDASTLNTWRTNLAGALDGVGGSAGVPYTPATAIEIGGSSVKLVGGVQLLYSSRTIVRQQSMIANTTSANWSRVNTPRGAWHNTAEGGTLDILMDRLIHGAVLAGATLRWIGAAGHVGLPTLPTWTLRRIDNDGAETSIATATDASVSSVAYEVAHNILNTSIGHTVDLVNYRYVMTLTGETISNFVTGGKVLTVYATHTVTAQPEG